MPNPRGQARVLPAPRSIAFVGGFSGLSALGGAMSVTENASPITTIGSRFYAAGSVSSVLRASSVVSVHFVSAGAGAATVTGAAV